MMELYSFQNSGKIIVLKKDWNHIGKCHASFFENLIEFVGEDWTLSM
jgi:hypothetical protein